MSRGSFLVLLGGEASGGLMKGVDVDGTGTTNNDGSPAASRGSDGGLGGGDDDGGSGVGPVRPHSVDGGEGGAEEYSAQ
eukprot:2482912-Pleurochrysis_carterae.AAC.1